MKKLLILRKTPFYTEQLLYKHFFRNFNPFPDISLYSVRRNTRICKIDSKLVIERNICHLFVKYTNI